MMDSIALHNWKRNTAVFLTSQIISLFGSSLVQYAIMWYITLETRSGAMMTVYIICGFVPTLILSPFGGVWADRYDRRKLIMIADGIIALATLAIAIVYLSGFKPLWLLFVVSAVRATGSAAHGPAVGAILPQMVPGDKLLRVNSINGSLQSTIMLVSPMLSGALLAFASIEAIFFIDVITATLAIGTLGLFLRIPPHAKAVGPLTTGYFEDMRMGFRYIREHRYLASFFGYLGIFMFLVTPAAFLTPLQTARTYGPEVWRLTALEIFFSGGMMAGGALLAAWGGFRNRMNTMVASNLIMAACTIALGLAPPFWLYLAFLGIFGISMPMYNTPSAVMLQEHVEGDYMGRVFSILTMIMTSAMPLGMLVFGPLADLVKIEWILLATGAVMVFHGLRVLGSRRLMEAGVPVVHAGTAAAPPVAAESASAGI